MFFKLYYLKLDFIEADFSIKIKFKFAIWAYLLIL